mgnify:CR=1 FL=1
MIILWLFILCCIIVLFKLFSGGKKQLDWTNDNFSDYEVLKYYLTNNAHILSQDTKKSTSEFIISGYIKYFCMLHISYIQNTYPPAQLAAKLLGGMTFSADLVVQKVIDDFKIVGKHPTLGDLYSDAFIILGHLRKADYLTIPQLAPMHRNKYILNELCDKKLLLQYVKTMQDILQKHTN